MTRLANTFVAIAALGGCLMLLLVAVVAGSGPGTVAATVLFGLFAWVAKSHIANVRHLRERLAARRAVVAMPQLMPVPERQALQPLQWAVPMYEELDWVSPQLQRHVHRMVLLLVEQHAGDMADELTRQLNAAQRTVRGEIAS